MKISRFDKKGGEAVKLVIFLAIGGLLLSGCSPASVNDDQTQPKPSNSETSSPNSQDDEESNACEAALNGNEKFVEVINGIQNNEMSTEVAAELSGEIEKSLDDAWETIDDPSFQTAMLEMANVIGVARMSLENGDLDSYQLMVDEFIVSGGYFRPYCE